MAVRFAVGKPESITTDVANEHFNDVFRRHVGRGKPWLPDEVARLTGIPIKTVESYRNEKAPQNANLLKLFAVLGPAFASDWLSYVGMKAEASKGHGLSIYDIASEAASFVHMHTDHMRDGTVDHMERRRTVDEARRLRATLDDFLASESV